MPHRNVTLNDRYDLTKTEVLLNGTQALVRMMLMQRARDVAAGLNTAGYVTGYRGSPLGAVDMQMTRAADVLAQAQVVFQAGLNEDLAATALWGTQQAALRGEGKYDGVFGLWYGKGPGVDRSGDVMRHANMAGTSPSGGVVMAMGDDHTGESSTTLHQSDFAMVEAYMPIVSPAGVQEIMDYGLYAWALSRYAGLWVGLKTMKDTVEVTSVANGDPHRLQFETPDDPLPAGGLNIRLNDSPPAQEARVVAHKMAAAEAFSRVNRMDQRKWGRAGAKIGFVAAGKNWLDLVHALSLLGVRAQDAEGLGITTYKVGQVWPLDRVSFQDWAAGLDLVVVVEEKRKLIEGQIKDVLFDVGGVRVFGWHKGAEVLFATTGDLNPIVIAEKLGGILVDEGVATDGVVAGLARLAQARRADNAPDIAARTPYFCAGCPHNTSTKVPEGSRAYAGIGCHYLVQFMDRETTGFTQMGGEGANWVGEAPFSQRAHVFQNVGDGTYNHSGVQAIRFALMAGTTITYKILFNDAVAMTGGQGNDGGLTGDQICRELLAMGVKDVALVYDDKEDIDLSVYPSGIWRHERAEMPDVQEKMSKIKGVSAIVYVQTCAAEKRRRRKRGQFPDPDKRVFINTDICEGCGDCGVQSNCVSIVPVETELGRKRAIDQSSCNKDYSCVAGFCPSFVTVQGAKIRKAPVVEVELPVMPAPVVPQIEGTHNLVITGVGGTGVVTIGAVLAMAAHLDAKGVSMMEMAGLAQKGGAVHINCRVAKNQSDINGVRVSMGECDTLIGGDLVVSAGAKTIGLMTAGRTRGIVNSHEIMTGEFTRDADFRLPVAQLKTSLAARLGDGLAMFDASALAKALMGDSIYSNMMVFGAAWQMGAVPLEGASIARAIEMNGASVAQNLKAFELGRWAYLHPVDAAAVLTGDVPRGPKTVAQMIAFRITHLQAYQGAELAQKYEAMVARFAGHPLQESVVRSYHKLLSYKDEYEVARLLLQTRAKARDEFAGDLKLTYHLAPPVLTGKGPDGRPTKRAFGAWLEKGLPWLARMKGLRGTPFDPFGYAAERRMERELIARYEADLARLLMDDGQGAAAQGLAAWPMQVRGFGPVKALSVVGAMAKRDGYLSALNEQRA